MTHTTSLHDFNKVLWNYVPASKDYAKNAVTVKGNTAYNENGEAIAVYNRKPDLKKEEEKAELKMIGVMSPLLVIGMAMVVGILVVIILGGLG